MKTLHLVLQLTWKNHVKAQQDETTLDSEILNGSLGCRLNSHLETSNLSLRWPSNLFGRMAGEMQATNMEILQRSQTAILKTITIFNQRRSPLVFESSYSSQRVSLL